MAPSARPHSQGTGGLRTKDKSTQTNSQADENLKRFQDYFHEALPEYPDRTFGSNQGTPPAEEAAPSAEEAVPPAEQAPKTPKPNIRNPSASTKTIQAKQLKGEELAVATFHEWKTDGERMLTNDDAVNKMRSSSSVPQKSDTIILLNEADVTRMIMLHVLIPLEMILYVSTKPFWALHQYYLKGKSVTNKDVSAILDYCLVSKEASPIGDGGKSLCYLAWEFKGPGTIVELFKENEDRQGLYKMPKKAEENVLWMWLLGQAVHNATMMHHKHIILTDGEVYIFLVITDLVTYDVSKLDLQYTNNGGRVKYHSSPGGKYEYFVRGRSSPELLRALLGFHKAAYEAQKAFKPVLLDPNSTDNEHKQLCESLQQPAETAASRFRIDQAEKRKAKQLAKSSDAAQPSVTADASTSSSNPGLSHQSTDATNQGSDLAGTSGANIPPNPAGSSSSTSQSLTSTRAGLKGGTGKNKAEQGKKVAEQKKKTDKDRGKK